MRKLEKTKFGGFTDAEKGGLVLCPLTYSQSEGAFNCCQDDCAWFALVEEYGAPLTRNVCLCDKKIIGRLA